jgi:Cys-rich four helix bundle protein (predicted Tat secretion target)
MTYSRRDLLAAGGAAAAMLAASPTLAAPKPPDAPHQHHHAPAGPLAEAAAQCAKVGEQCLQHCLDAFAAGDLSMADCAKSVRDMKAIASAIYTLSVSGSKHVKAAAKVAAEVAKECEVQCRKHGEKHEVCKTCAECCAALIAESAKV